MEDSVWPRRAAIAAIAYTFITLIILIVSAYQTYLIRSNNVVSQRAFVSVAFKAGTLAYAATPKKLTLGSISDSVSEGAAGIAIVNFIAELTNSGNTGTKNLTFFLKCATSVERLQEPWSILYQGVSNPLKTPQFIGPHSSSQLICGYSGEQIRAISKGTLFGYIMLDATYQDRLIDEWHKTHSTVTIAQAEFVPAIEPSGTRGFAVNAVLATYGNNNCADEECPK